MPGGTVVLAAFYSSRTITIIVPYGSGSGLDINASNIAPRIAEKLKQAVVAINKPGAGDIQRHQR
jgi:tripartite-type tricarboxylate transporter receptor subunit TctC